MVYELSCKELVTILSTDLPELNFPQKRTGGCAVSKPKISLTFTARMSNIGDWDTERLTDKEKMEEGKGGGARRWGVILLFQSCGCLISLRKDVDACILPNITTRENPCSPVALVGRADKLLLLLLRMCSKEKLIRQTRWSRTIPWLSTAENEK